MMKVLISGSLTALFSLGGVMGGLLVKGPAASPNLPAAPVHAGSNSELGPHVSASNHTAEGAEHKSADSDAGEIKTESVMGPEYYPLRFSRPFVVPISDDGWQAQTLIVLQLSVELHNDAGNGAPGLEQRLRDRIMSGLIQMSHEGGFHGGAADPEILEEVRMVAKAAIEKIVPGMSGEVLVLDILRRRV